jgi:hypothetical protein
MVENSLGIVVDDYPKTLVNQMKAPGLLKSHYSPTAKVLLNGIPSEGDGFIALATHSTPQGAIRLASPNNNTEYAKELYQALRLADNKNLKRVFVIPPIGDDIAVAIRDRLRKSKS